MRAEARPTCQSLRLVSRRPRGRRGSWISVAFAATAAPDEPAHRLRRCGAEGREGSPARQLSHRAPPTKPPSPGEGDIYAMLRRQYKPVEMVLIPGGFHSLWAPSERMVSLQGNVDWYRFWLKGEKRTTPMLAGETVVSLRAQYEAWEQMEKLKALDDGRPRCAREPSRG